jgi:regulator of protease activity HflC (stomatin/prohibitin superfamily)
LAFIVLSTSWPLRTVPTGSRGVITVGGAIKGIEGEGFTWIWPWQRIDNFSIRAEAADIKDADGATSDTQPVTTSLTVRYSIVPDQVAKVFEQYSHNGNLDSYITTATMETFKAVTARYTATDLIGKRSAVSADIATLLKQKVSLYGAQVLNIDMTNFKFSPQYMQAINEKVTQEQLRLAAENKVKTVEAEQTEAEGRRSRGRGDGIEGQGRRRGLRRAQGCDRAGRGPAHSERGPGSEQGCPRVAPHRSREGQGREVERGSPAGHLCRCASAVLEREPEIGMRRANERRRGEHASTRLNATSLRRLGRDRPARPRARDPRVPTSHLGGAST